MFKGLSTLEAYENCISAGLCGKHFIDFEKESNTEERHELQRKAFLYIRLRILDPLLFRKRFVFEKMEALISKSDYFSSTSFNQGTNGGINFIDNILLLDSIVVFTLCQFCKICCCGCLFQSNQTIELGLDHEFAFIQKLLNCKNVTENDIRHLYPVLQDNFIGYDKSLIKFCYVVALLFVRNTTIKVRLKQALTELTTELQKSSLESERWLDIAREAELKKNYEESLEAITSALNYNPYCYRMLAARGTLHIRMKEFKKAELDSYVSTIINPQHFIAYGNLCFNLIHGKLFQDCLELLKYAMKKCEFDKLSKNPDFLELEKILDNEKQFDNISQFKSFEELFMKHYENLANNDMVQNFTKECLQLKKEIKSDLKNTLENGIKNSFPEIEDIPDLEEAQDSEDEAEASLPDLSDASRSDGSDYEDTANTTENKNSTPGDETDSPKVATGLYLVEAQTAELEKKVYIVNAQKSETNLYEIKTKDSETESSESVIDKFMAKSSEDKKAESKKCEIKKESQAKNTEIKSSEVKKSETKSSKSSSLNLLQEAPSKQQFCKLLKEGSQMLLDGCGYTAVNQFVSALEIIELTEEKNSSYEPSEIVCIKYACGLAYCSSGGYDDLQKGIEIFKQIIENHSNVTFPAAYYGIGLAYHKLNRFKDALKYLKTVNDILEKGICFKVYTWPGLKTVISETKSEQLKALVSCKIRECEMPPPPDAICRYEECLTQPPIYYSDPDFKGFLDLQCSDHCTLQYHAVCWKTLKTSRNLTDKEFLEKSCLTPDCKGIIMKVEIINKEGAIDKVFRSVQERKPVKTKKPKPPKRVDSKEEKRKKRHPHRDSESDKMSQADENAQNSHEINACDKENHQNENSEKEKSVPHLSNAVPLSVNAEPFIIIRKEKLSDENVLKTPAKPKELKKSKPVTISFTEFCKDTVSQTQYTPTYQQGESYSYTKEEWPSCKESSSHPPSSECQEISTFLQQPEEAEKRATLPSELDCDPLEVDDFDAIKNNLYNYLEEFLTRNGPLSVRDVRLVRELETFPTEANVVIAKYGGITEFLKNDIEYRFGIVDDLFICSRCDLAVAYKLSRSSGVMGADNADLLEEYGVRCTNLGGSSSHVGPTLNPDAKEYRPSSSVASSSTNSYTSLPEEEIPFDVPKTDKSPRTPSSSLMSTISKLRQPLAVDEEGSNNFLHDHLVTANTKAVKEESTKNLAEKCIGAVKLYLSEGMDSERAYIDSCIKPFKIATSPNQSSKALQTNVIKTESRGTLKTDEEVSDLMKLAKKLTEEKMDLEIQKTLLETKLTTEMDAAAKSNKKALVEIEYLKKELEDSNLALQSLKSEYKNKEMKLEREHKVLMESLNKSSELSDAQEKEINIWCSKNQSLQEKLKKMEESMEDLLKENNSLKKSLDQQVEKYNSSIQTAENEKLQVTQRAKSAEMLFLKFRKEIFLMKIDYKAKEAKSTMKGIEDFLPMVNSNPLYKKNLEILHTSISNYIKKLAEMRLDLQARCDEQINAVDNGVLLETLTPVEAKELPEIPCFTTQFPATNPSMNNPMAIYNSVMLAGSQMQNRSNNSVSYVRPQCMPAPSSAIVRPPPPTTSSHQTLPTSSTQKVPPGIPSPPECEPAATREELRQNSPSSLSTFTIPPQTTKTVTPNVTTSPITNSSGAIPKTPALPATLPNVAVPNKSCDNLSLELDYKGKQDSEKTASTLSLTSSQGATKASAGKSCDKLLTKLELKYPAYDKAQLMSFIKEFRKNRKGGLSGLTIDSIISGVSALIDSQNQQQQPPPLTVPEVKNKMLPIAQNKLVNKKLVEKKDPRPTFPPQQQQQKASCPWAPSKNGEKNNWSGSGLEEGCIICYEEMTPSNAYRVECGHCFHMKCIREWLNKKSDCPICRVHILLPEDYPALS